MASRYELPISTGYEPDWGIVEGFRELFQNALDRQADNTDSKMIFEYDKNAQAIRIGNKDTALTLDTLLMGASTKQDQENTNGKYGERYKVAFMVLSRAGKTVKVYNHGNRELWTTKLVKAERYDNALITVIDIDKNLSWNGKVGNDLVIEVIGITPEDYAFIIERVTTWLCKHRYRCPHCKRGSLSNSQ